MMLMTIASSYANPLLPVFTSTVAAALLPTDANHTATTTCTNFKRVKIEERTRRRRRWGVSSSSDNQTVVEAPAATPSSSSPPAGESPSSEVVRNFYGGINGRDLAFVEELIAHNCVYEDLIFSRPFVGRKAILEFFQKFIDSISMDLQFVIDDISEEDTSALGVTWHLEWKGKPFPFSKGCSFYRLELVNGKRQITDHGTTICDSCEHVALLVCSTSTLFSASSNDKCPGYGRDSVEPAIKPGEMALVAIRGVTWLLQRFPQLADQL